MREKKDGKGYKDYQKKNIEYFEQKKKGKLSKNTDIDLIERKYQIMKRKVNTLIEELKLKLETKAAKMKRYE